MLVNYVCKPLYKGDSFKETTKLKMLQDKAKAANALYKSIVKAV